MISIEQAQVRRLNHTALFFLLALVGGCLFPIFALVGLATVTSWILFGGAAFFALVAIGYLIAHRHYRNALLLFGALACSTPLLLGVIGIGVLLSPVIQIALLSSATFLMVAFLAYTAWQYTQPSAEKHWIKKGKRNELNAEEQAKNQKETALDSALQEEKKLNLDSETQIVPVNPAQQPQPASKPSTSQASAALEEKDFTQQQDGDSSEEEKQGVQVVYHPSPLKIDTQLEIEIKPDLDTPVALDLSSANYPANAVKYYSKSETQRVFTEGLKSEENEEIQKKSHNNKQ